MISLSNVRVTKKNFSLAIDQLRINRGVNLMVGNNGAGKSTLLHLLATARSPHRGTITYAGKMNLLLSEIRSEIGFLPTGVELYDEMTVKKFLLYMAQLKGLSKEDTKKEVKDLIRQLNLLSMQHTKIKKLSEGYKQRTGIAQALIGLPFFLFLDEPLVGLDIHEKKLVINYIGKHYSKNRVAVVVTHEMNEWAHVCDQLLMVEQGKVSFYGTPTQWKYHTSLFVWEGSITKATWELFATSENVIRAKKKNNQYIVRMISGVQPNSSFQIVKPTLEDSYFIKKLYNSNHL